MSVRNRKLLLVIAVVIFTLFAAGAALAADIPPQLAVSDLERVDFGRADTTYRALFPGIPEDREKIARLVELYNQAIPSLGPEVSFFEENPEVMPMFLHEVSFSLTGGRSVILVLYQGASFYTENLAQSRRVTDPEVSKELEELALSYFAPIEGAEISAREFRMGQQVTVSSDAARGKEAYILLMPSNRPAIVPSTPFYPVPEAFLLATIPVEYDRFSYTFTLAEEMGRMMDGSPGRVGPGAWRLAVRSGGGGLIILSLTILPAEAPEPRAVVYDRERVYTWSAAEGVRTGTLERPADQPLLINGREGGSPEIHLSLPFLLDWLEVPVTDVGPTLFRLGPPSLGLTVDTGEQKALLNGTVIELGAGLRKMGGVMKLSWSELDSYFGYRTQWLGPEKVAFLRNLDELPAELNKVLPASLDDQQKGRKVTVALRGKSLDLGARQAYLDAGRGRVMVPLRATVQVLGGQLASYPLKPGSGTTSAETNHGLPLWGGEVNNFVEVSLGNKAWGAYLTPVAGGTTMVPLRDLALALGFDLAWNGSESIADLQPEE